MNTLEGDMWPSDKAIAVIHFREDGMALQWFNERRNEPPLQDADVLIQNMTHPFNTGTQAVTSVTIYFSVIDLAQAVLSDCVYFQLAF